MVVQVLELASATELLYFPTGWPLGTLMGELANPPDGIEPSAGHKFRMS